MIIDDYEWQLFPMPEFSKKLAIDSFLSCFRNFFEILSLDRQVILRKVSHAGQWVSTFALPLNEWAFLTSDCSLIHLPSKKISRLLPEQTSLLEKIMSQPAYTQARDVRDLQKFAMSDPNLQGVLSEIGGGRRGENESPGPLVSDISLGKRRESRPCSIGRTDFFGWGFGEAQKVDFVSAQDPGFSCWLKPSIERKDYDFREEVFRAVERLNVRRAGKEVALCFTGGQDSSLIAHVLASLDIPFHLYFLRNWQLNEVDLLERAAPTAKQLGKDVRVVDLSREYFIEEFAPGIFREFGCEAPTYLALVYLFGYIPESEYVVVGDGDFNREGDLYAEIARRNPPRRPNSLPTAASAVLFSNWKEKRGRDGEFAFFRSTAELAAATFTHPKFQLRYPFSSAREVILHDFPELSPRAKTTNWDSFLGWQDNAMVRRRLTKLAAELPGFEAWLPAMGTNLCVDDLFLPSLG
jgi:hypothetical protein